MRIESRGLRVSSWQRGVFEPLAVPAYRTLWTATLLQFSGMMTAGVVRGFLAFDLTESNGAVAGLFFAFGITMFPAMFWAGVVTDRVSRKALLAGAQIFLAAQAVLLGLLVLTDQLAYWMLLVQSMFEGVTVAFLAPSRQAMNGQLLGAAGVGRGVVLQQGSMGIARIYGPLIGGVLIGTAVGAGGVFLLIAGFFLWAALLTLRIPGSFRGGDGAREGSFLRDLVAGMRYVRGRPALFVTVLVAYVVAFSAFPYFVFLPGMVLDVFERDAFELGLINSAAAVGSVVVAVLVAAVVHRPGAWGLFLAISFAFGPLVIAFGLAPSFWAALPIIMLVGGAEIGFISLAMGLGMAYSHRLYDGRVQSLIVSSFSLFGVASLPLGLLGDAIGIRETLVLQGTVGAALVGVLALYARRIGAGGDARVPAEDEPAPSFVR